MRAMLHIMSIFYTTDIMAAFDSVGVIVIVIIVVIAVVMVFVVSLLLSIASIVQLIKMRIQFQKMLMIDCVCI